MVLEKGYRHPDQDLIARIKERSVGPRRAVWADLGSGSSVHVKLLRHRFRAAYGIDADPAYLASASRPDILGDLLRLPWKDGTFRLQHALARAFPRASLFTSNYLVFGKRLSA